MFSLVLYWIFHLRVSVLHFLLADIPLTFLFLDNELLTHPYYIYQIIPFELIQH